MIKIPAENIIRLGCSAKNIFSLNDWLQINGKRVLEIRIVDSKIIYETSVGGFTLDHNSVVMVSIAAAQKYVSAAQSCTPKAKEESSTTANPATQNSPASNLKNNATSTNEYGFFSSLGEAFRLMVFVVPLSFVAAFVVFGLDQCTGVISGAGKTCAEKYEEAWEECNDDYNGKCHYLGPRYKPGC